jgi:hypothetical protein
MGRVFPRYFGVVLNGNGDPDVRERCICGLLPKQHIQPSAVVERRGLLFDEDDGVVLALDFEDLLTHIYLRIQG